MQPDIEKIASLLHEICVNCKVISDAERMSNSRGHTATVRFPPLQNDQPLININGFRYKGSNTASAHEKMHSIQCTKDTEEAVHAILAELRLNKLLDHPKLKIEIQVRRPAKTSPRAILSLEGIEVGSNPVTPKTLGKKLNAILDTLSLAPAEILEGNFRAFKVNGTLDVYAPSPEAAIYKARAWDVHAYSLTEIIDHEAVTANLKNICQAA